ncbi:hypothetical protein ACO22_07714 [Paracoccidioides brasiliensis]|nr:hypothetical protein ACO22_07714 [Paracoccidioides brasiliensis]
MSCTEPTTIPLEAMRFSNVVSHFKGASTCLAGIDSVVSKDDTVVYAQEVLIPELLEMSVQEDMSVDAKEGHQPSDSEEE